MVNIQDEEILYGKNLYNPIVEIYHAHLIRANDDSVFRSRCPFCTTGTLLVMRCSDGILSDIDRCISCGQMVKYKDMEEIRKKYG